MNGAKEMKDLTHAEYEVLDERWTATTPKVNFSKPGVFAQQQVLLDALDDVSAAYLKSRAEADHKTPAQIIGQLVHEKIAASA
ncbi:hypothetical protein AGMMS49940_24250 [Spirochaetia bacterium]|nr:hypothetical protein AGMMS49940_24230 [Spirochaetia bacterium]GHV75123.1 hypothetical protein AGMMS49940_24250 [Spirochaetia bacterium]